MDERAILVAVAQCLLLLTRMHHSYITHAVSWRGARGAGVGRRGAVERMRWVGERAILVVVTQCLLLLAGSC